MATLSEKLKKLLDKELTPDEKKLLQITEFESRKTSVVVRMPAGVLSLAGLWERVREISLANDIAISKANTYATAEELDEILGNVDWLWKHWIPRGFITMLAGDPGIGKTMIAVDFARIVAAGTTFPLSEIVHDEKPVIWVDAEAGHQILRERLISLKVDRSKVFIPVIDGDILCQPDFGNEDHKEYIRGMIEALHPVMLILDSLGGSNRKGENKVEEVRPLMEYFAKLAQEFNIAVLMLHHLNKGSPGETSEVSLYRIRGSTAIPAFCRSIIAAEHGSEENQLKLRVIKSNLARPQPEISIKSTLDPEGNVLALLYDLYKSPDKKKTLKERCADWVISLLNTSPDFAMILSDIIELGRDMGFSRNTIYSAKDVLGDRVTFGGTGNKARWSITSQSLEDTESVALLAGVLTHANNDK